MLLLRTKVPGSESSRANSLRGAKVPGSEKARERKFQGTKGPGSESSGSELARVLLELSLRGANWPGSEKAVNRQHFVLKIGNDQIGINRYGNRMARNICGWRAAKWIQSQMDTLGLRRVRYKTRSGHPISVH